MSTSKMTTSYTTKGGQTVTLSTPKASTPRPRLETAIAFYYEVKTTMTVKDRKPYTLYHVEQHNYMSNPKDGYRLLSVDFPTLAHNVASGNIASVIENNVGYFHETIYNYAIALTLKAYKYYGGVQGNARDQIQQHDMIEAITNSYTAIIETLKLACEKDYDLSQDDLTTAIRKSLNALIFKSFRAYTYQLHRDNQHLALDGLVTDSEGNTVSQIDLVASDMVKARERAINLEALTRSMSTAQVVTLQKALNEKQVNRFATLVAKKLQGVALEDSERKSYERYTKLIQSTHAKLNKAL